MENKESDPKKKIVYWDIKRIGVKEVNFNNFFEEETRRGKSIRDRLVEMEEEAEERGEENLIPSQVSSQLSKDLSYLQTLDKFKDYLIEYINKRNNHKNRKKKIDISSIDIGMFRRICTGSVSKIGGNEVANLFIPKMADNMGEFYAKEKLKKKEPNINSIPSALDLESEVNEALEYNKNKLKEPLSKRRKELIEKINSFDNKNES